MKTILFLLLIPCLSYSQAKFDLNQLIKDGIEKESNKTVKYKNIIINDSSIIKVCVSKTTFVRNRLSDCCTSNIQDYERETLFAGDTVVISGIISCKSCYTDNYMNFYEVIHKNKRYYIVKDELMSDADYYTQIEKMTLQSSGNFRRNAQNFAESEFSNKIHKLRQIINSYKLKGLVILYWNKYDESEYTDGTDLTFNVYNPTNKTIKYISFTVIGYNAVNDVIVDRIKRRSRINVKGVGPIKPKESATYDFDYVWYSDLVDTAKISEINVLYMDGRSIKIQNAKSIMPKLSYEDLKLLGESDFEKTN